MHFDIVEAIRQKQRKEQRSISIENGDVVDITISDDGKVIVSPAVPPRRDREDEIEPKDELAI